MTASASIFERVVTYFPPYLIEALDSDALRRGVSRGEVMRMRLSDLYGPEMAQRSRR